FISGTQVVEDDYLMSCTFESASGMTTDISSASNNKNDHRMFPFQISRHQLYTGIQKASQPNRRPASECYDDGNRRAFACGHGWIFPYDSARRQQMCSM